MAFYNGVRLPFELLGRPPEDWGSSGYKIHVNADYESGLRMDIPAKYIDRDNYKATLGKTGRRLLSLAKYIELSKYRKTT